MRRSRPDDHCYAVHRAHYDYGFRLNCQQQLYSNAFGGPSAISINRDPHTTGEAVVFPKTNARGVVWRGATKSPEPEFPVRRAEQPSLNLHTTSLRSRPCDPRVTQVTVRRRSVTAYRPEGSFLCSQPENSVHTPSITGTRFPSVSFVFLLYFQRPKLIVM